MAGLFVAEQVAGAADVEVVARQLEPGTQRIQRVQHLQALLGLRRDGLVRGQGEQRVGASLRAADASTQLVELGEAEHVGAMHDQRVGARDVEAGLDDRGGEEDVVFAVVEGRHLVFEFGRRHLTVRDDDLGLRHRLAQEGLRLVELLDARADVEALAAAIALAEQGFAHQEFVERRNESAHGEPVDRRRRDDGKIAYARHGELQRSRDRRRRERQHMDLGAQVLQPLLVLDAEVLLLVDDDEAEVLEVDALAEHGVRADDDVDLAGGETGARRLQIGAADHARQLRDLDRQMREAFGEILVVLAGEQGRRYHDGDLLAVDGGGEGGAHRHLGFAEADVAADEPVHRVPGGEVFQRRIDGRTLVVGLVVGEAGAELGVEAVGWRQFRGRLGGAGRRDLDEACSHLKHALAHPRLALLPGAAAEPVELDLGVLRAVARQQFEVLDGQVKLDAVGIVQLQAVVADAGRLDRMQAVEAGDAVVGVDHDVAGGNGADLGEEVLCAFGVLALADEPVAEDILLGDDGDVAGLETLLQAEDGERRLFAFVVQRVRQRRDVERRGEPMIGEHAGETFARPVRPCGEDDVLAAGLQLADVLGCGLEDVAALVGAFGREVAPGASADIDHEATPVRLGVRGDLHRRHLGEALQPSLLVKVKRGRRERLVGRVGGRAVVRGLAGVVIVLDLRQPLDRRLLHGRVENHRRASRVGEQRVEVFVEQRQPVFEPGRAAPLADRLVKLVAACLAAKLRRVSAAETADRLARQLHLAHRHEVEALELAGGALRLRVEGADRLQRVAEEVEADRLRQRRREQVDDAAAHGVFAGVAHGGVAREPVDFQPFDQLVYVDGVARRGGERVLRHASQRRHLLENRPDRRRQDARALLGRARPGQPRQRRHPARRDRGIRRDAVVGLAVPTRQVEDLNVGRGEGQRLVEGASARFVPSDMEEHHRSLFRVPRERVRQVGHAERVEALWHGR